MKSGAGITTLAENSRLTTSWADASARRAFMKGIQFLDCMAKCQPKPPVCVTNLRPGLPELNREYDEAVSTSNFSITELGV